MPALVRATELGFAEFVGTLVSEVVESLAASQGLQARQLEELDRALAVRPEEFAAEFVEDQDVVSELERLFPAEGSGRPHGAAPGASYSPPGPDGAEEPPFLRLLGVELASVEDFQSPGAGGSTVLTADGAAKVAGAVQRKLGERQQRLLNRVANRGIPWILPYDVTICSKLTISALEERQDDAGGAPIPGGGLFFREVSGITPRRPTPIELPGLVEATTRAARSPVRLMIRPANERMPELTTTRVDIVSEVKVSLKAITV
jgi:hypothetical protein